jgi:hypothetical protein
MMNRNSLPQEEDRFDNGAESLAEIRSVLRSAGSTATAARVNRTHRVVHERAKTIAARRSKIRSLWVPLFIFSTLLVALCFAVWTVLDEYEVAAAGSQVGSYQVLVPLFWSIPVSAALLAVVWFRQTRGSAGRGATE